MAYAITIIMYLLITHQIVTHALLISKILVFLKIYTQKLKYFNVTQTYACSTLFFLTFCFVLFLSRIAKNTFILTWLPTRHSRDQKSLPSSVTEKVVSQFHQWCRQHSSTGAATGCPAGRYWLPCCCRWSARAPPPRHTRLGLPVPRCSSPSHRWVSHPGKLKSSEFVPKF